tara:strand:+ start:26 stop:763 length:738 start_codon:yes stop_codon:yes gene_type:complete
MKVILYIIIFIIISPIISKADTYEKKRFNIEAKFGILPSIDVMEIYTELKLNEDNFNYIFNIKSKNIVKFLTEVNGIGSVEGKVFANKYIPSNYTYSYRRKEKNKYVEIVYKENKIEKVVVKPSYDKSKLTPLTDKMLQKTIDPPTFFLSILNYKNLNNCQKTFSVFDGKRRYDVIFNKLDTSSSDLIECSANQIKIGGYKDRENDVFAASDFIKIVYDKKKDNEFLRYEARNGSINVIIKEIEN